jgi:transcriptional regulator with XRE-family HTH domain
MEIKKKLKALDIKISKLATELGVSRPTLDAYIEYYENGQPIPNEGYQKIFDYLFSREDMNSIDFAQKYDYVKRVMLADAKAGVEKNIHNEREGKILENIINLLETKTVDEHLVEFINLFINNKENSLVKSIYMYFNYANGFADISNDTIDDIDKALYSNLAKVFQNYQNNKLDLFEDYYENFVNKNKELVDKKAIKVKDSDIVEYIQNKLNSSDNLDIEELKKMINSREE